MCLLGNSHSANDENDKKDGDDESCRVQEKFNRFQYFLIHILYSLWGTRGDLRKSASSIDAGYRRVLINSTLLNNGDPARNSYPVLCRRYIVQRYPGR